MKKLKKYFYYFFQNTEKLLKENIDELVCSTWERNLSSEDIKKLIEYIDKMDKKEFNV